MSNSLVRLNGTEPPEEAIPILVAAHGGRIYSLGMRLCGNREEAEDLVQETFMQAFKKWSQFEGRSRPSTWLYTIASRICQRLHRKKSGEPDQVGSLDELLPFTESCIAVAPEKDSGPLDELIRKEGQDRIEAEIAALPITFRMPLILKEIVGFSLSEIAEILGTKEGTVKTRLHRARLRIRKALEEALPRKEVPFPVYSRQVCLDLLQAKQETLDRGVGFDFPDQVVCDRCAEVFATMDLAQDICHGLAKGELPEALRRQVLEQAAANA